MDPREIFDKRDTYKQVVDLPKPPDDDHPVLAVAWWQTISEIAEANKWQAVLRAKETYGWDPIGNALNMSSASARQAVRVRKNRGDL